MLSKGSSRFLRVLDISNRKQDNPTITDQALNKVIKFTGICLSIQCTLGMTVTGNICYMSKRLVPVLTPLLAEVNSKNNLKASILLPFQHMKRMHTVTCPDNVFFKMLKTIFQKVNFRDKKDIIQKQLVSGSKAVRHRKCDLLASEVQAVEL